MMEQLNAGLTRLAAAAEALESSAARMTAEEQGGAVAKITAAVDHAVEGWTSREVELQRRLEQALSALQALQADGVPNGGRAAAARKTLPTATVQLLAKQGLDVGDAMDLPTLDAALAGMSVEQRIAVKSQLLRTGSLSL